MNDSYLDLELNFSQFIEDVELDSDLTYGLRTNFTNWIHPALVLQNLYEVHKYQKQLLCLQSDSKSGQSSNSIIYLLDSFVKQTQKQSNDVGQYLIILSATRESSTYKYNFIEKLLKRKKKYSVIDINQFFPIKSKGRLPQIILPPTSQPTIILGTPQTFLKLLSLTSIEQNCIKYIMYDECQLMQVFGGQEQLKEIYNWSNNNNNINNRVQHLFIGTEQLIEQLCGRKPTLIMIEIDMDAQEIDEDDEEQTQKKGQIGNYFYHVAKDNVQQFILMYITLKLNLLHGKTLIIVQDLNNLLLQRMGMDKFQIYNHENPKSLKYYVLSTFNTGVLQTLVATPAIFEDLKTQFFERTKSKKKRGRYQFKKLDNIILQNIDPNSIDCTHHFNGSGNVLVIQNQNDEQGIENLIHWMNVIKNTSINLKSYPLSFEEIEAFRYRIEDVATNISKHQIKIAQAVDFKKKMVKSPDLEEYFKTHIKEKELLQQQIVQMKAQLKKFEIRADGIIPDYLLPQIIIQQRKMQNENSDSKKFSKILISKSDVDKSKLISKRKLLSQNTVDMLPNQQQQTDNEQIEDVVQKKVKQGDQYVYLNEDREDPNMVDPIRLPTISSRKLWKLRHGFKLTKRNKRMEKKGIFTT